MCVMYILYDIYVKYFQSGHFFTLPHPRTNEKTKQVYIYWAQKCSPLTTSQQTLKNKEKKHVKSKHTSYNTKKPNNFTQSRKQPQKYALPLGQL